MERNSRIKATQDPGRAARDHFSLHSWESSHLALPKQDLPPFPEPFGRFWSNQQLSACKGSLGTPASQSSTRETRLAEQEQRTQCSLPFQSPVALGTSSNAGSIGLLRVPANLDNSLDDVINQPSKDLSTSLKTKRKLQRPQSSVDGDAEDDLNWIQDAHSEDLSDLMASPDVSLQDSLVAADSTHSFRLRARTAASRLLTPAASELQKAMEALEQQTALTLRQLEKAMDSLVAELRAEHSVVFQQTLRDLSLMTPQKKRKSSWADVFVCSQKPKKQPTAEQPTASSFLSYLNSSTATTATDPRKSHLFLKAYQITADLVFGAVAPSEGCVRTPESSAALPEHDAAGIESKMRYFYVHRRLQDGFEVADFGGADLLSLLTVSRFFLRNQNSFSELWLALRRWAPGGQPLSFLLDFAHVFYPAYSSCGPSALNSPVTEGLEHFWHHFESSLWVYLGSGNRGTKPPGSVELLPSSVEAALRKSLSRKEPLSSSARTAILQALR